MQVKYAIILSAGKGTRMGALGKVLAKPVWPIFGITLIESQIKFLKERFGVEKIFINSHHLHHQLEPFQCDGVEIVYEPILLDQGGGILNILKKYNLWDLPVLVNNSDQFFFFSSSFFDSAIKKIEKSDAVLMGLQVEKGKGYNKLEVDNERVREITKHDEVEEETYYTYSGMGIIKAREVEYNLEILPFFSSVCDLTEKSVLLEEINSFDYYDFGKLDHYFNLCQEIKEDVLASRESNIISLFSSDIKRYITKDEGLNFSDEKDAKVNTNEILMNEGTLYLDKNQEICFLPKK